MNLTIKEVESFMREALIEANEARWKDEVPIGAIIIDENKNIVARSSNLKEAIHDVTGHAEIRALKVAAKEQESWRLTGHTLITTLEPCIMCLNAMLQARVKELYFGAYDKKGGALSLGYNLNQDKRLNHNFNAYGGIESYECSRTISNFFREKRKSFKS